MAERATATRWVYLWEAEQILKRRTGLEVSRSTWYRWRDEGKHDIVFGMLGSRVVVREDTIPDVFEGQDT